MVKKDTFHEEFHQKCQRVSEADSLGAFPEAVVRRSSVKDVPLKISQNWQGISCAGVF